MHPPFVIHLFLIMCSICRAARGQSENDGPPKRSVVSQHSTISYDAILASKGIKPETRCSAPQFLKDGSAVVIAIDRSIVAVSLPRMEYRTIVDACPTRVLDFTANGKSLLAVLCVDGSIVVYSANTGRPVYSSRRRMSGAARVLWGEKEGELLVSTANAVYLINLSPDDSTREVFRSGKEDGLLGHVQLIPGTTTIGCVTTKGYCEFDWTTQRRVYDARDVAPAGGWRTTRHPTQKVLGFFSFGDENENPLADREASYCVMTYDMVNQRRLGRCELQSRVVTSIAFDRSGDVLVIAGSLLRREKDDRSVRAFDTTRGLSEIEWPVGRSGSYDFVEFSADGGWHLVASSKECIVCSCKVQGVE